MMKSKSEKEFHVKLLKEELQDVCKQILKINDIIAKIDAKVHSSIEHQKQENEKVTTLSNKVDSGIEQYNNLCSIFNLLKSTVVNHSEMFEQVKDKIGLLSSKLTSFEKEQKSIRETVKDQYSITNQILNVNTEFIKYKEENTKNFLNLMYESERQNKLHQEYQKIIKICKYIILILSAFFILNVLYFILSVY